MNLSFKHPGRKTPFGLIAILSLILPILAAGCGGSRNTAQDSTPLAADDNTVFDTTEIYDSEQFPLSGDTWNDLRKQIDLAYNMFQYSSDEFLDLNTIFDYEYSPRYYMGGDARKYYFGEPDLRKFYQKWNLPEGTTLRDVINGDARGDKAASSALADIVADTYAKTCRNSPVQVLALNPQNFVAIIGWLDLDHDKELRVMSIHPALLAQYVPFGVNLIEGYVRKVSDGKISMRTLYNDSTAMDKLRDIFLDKFPGYADEDYNI